MGSEGMRRRGEQEWRRQDDQSTIGKCLSGTRHRAKGSEQLGQAKVVEGRSRQEPRWWSYYSSHPLPNQQQERQLLPPGLLEKSQAQQSQRQCRGADQGGVQADLQVEQKGPMELSEQGWLGLHPGGGAHYPWKPR